MIMNILALSDLHGINPRTIHQYLEENKIDLIIIAGDITHFGPPELARDILDDMAAHKIPVLAVPGNCDPHGIHAHIENSRTLNIHAKTTNIKGISFCGLGGSNPTPFNTPLEFEEDEIYQILKDAIKDDITILITHAPPYGTRADKLPSGEHVGSKSIRRIIEEHQPKLNICGHIHEGRGEDRIGDTIIINPGETSKGEACLIEIDDGKINTKFIKLG